MRNYLFIRRNFRAVFLAWGVVLSLAGAAYAETPAIPVDQQINDLDQLIETVETIRSAQETIDRLQEMLADAENDKESKESLLKETRETLGWIKDHIRTTDLLASGLQGVYGNDTTGVGYELRQLYGLVSKLDDVNGTPLKNYVEDTGKIFEAASAIDAVAQIFTSAAEGNALTGGEALSNLGAYLGDLEDAIGLLAVEVNPVITAMIVVYAGALESAGYVADNVIAPRTEKVNDAINSWNDIFEPDYATGANGAANETVRDDYLDNVLHELNLARDQLAASNDIDYRAAIARCQRSINKQLSSAAANSAIRSMDANNDGAFTDEDAETLRGQTNAAKTTLNRMGARIHVLRAALDPQNAFSLHRAVRDAQQNLNTAQNRLDNPPSAQSRDRDAAPVTVEELQGDVNHAQLELDQAQEALSDAQQGLNDLEAAFDEVLQDYYAAAPLYTAYKDCIRETLQQYAPDRLDDGDASYVPEWIKNCRYFELSDKANAIAHKSDLRPTAIPSFAYAEAPRSTQNVSYGNAIQMISNLAGFQVATDSPVWCTYGTGEGQPVTPAPTGFLSGKGRPLGHDVTVDNSVGGDRAEFAEQPGGGGPTDIVDRPGWGDATDLEVLFDDPEFQTGQGRELLEEFIDLVGRITDAPTDQSLVSPTVTPDFNEPTMTADNPQDEPQSVDPEDEPDKGPPPVRITFKATRTALQTGAAMNASQPQNGAQTAGNEIEGRRMKMIVPELQDPALPVAGASRPDNDFSEDPIQCTMDASGACVAFISSAMFAGDHIDASVFNQLPSFDIEVPVDEVKGVNVTVPGGGALPDRLQPFLSGSWSAGAGTTYALAFPSGVPWEDLLGAFTALDWEVDLCRIELPGAPPDFDRSKYAKPGGALPSQRLSFANESRGGRR